MGADLLLATLAHNKNKKLNWAGGRRAAQRMDRDRLLAACEEAWGFADSVTESRPQLNTLISQLKAELATDSRDAYTWEVGSWRIHIRGGTSFGDDPTQGWTVFSDMLYFPEVLAAIGFRLDAIKYPAQSAA